MLGKVIVLGVTALLAASPAVAQQRGTIEFGGFGTANTFDSRLGMERSFGAGARVGAFLFPRLSVEFEGGGSNANRMEGLQDVNVGVLSGRLLAVPLQMGPASILLGAGVDHTDTYILETYGYHGLIGAKLALSDAFAIRADALQSFMANQGGSNRSFRLGVVAYRSPGLGVSMASPAMTAPAPLAQRPDSVSAAETRRLRAAAASYEALRDSLARRPIASQAPMPARAPAAAMQEMIYFGDNLAVLTPAAQTVLGDKVAMFRSDPAMRIVITGFASAPGTTAHNMELGLRRAEAARAFLISRGIDASRIDVATRGEGGLAAEGTGESVDAVNRRGEFRILIQG